MLARVDKLLSCLVLANDWVPCPGRSRYVVPPGDSHFGIEVDKASGAPAHILLCEVVTYAIGDEVLYISLFDLVDLIVEGEVDVDGVVSVLALDSEGDRASLPIGGVRVDKVLK